MKMSGDYSEHSMCLCKKLAQPILSTDFNVQPTQMQAGDHLTVV